MERLTDRYDGEAILLCSCPKCEAFASGKCAAINPCAALQNALDRLAAYEDAEAALAKEGNKITLTLKGVPPSLNRTAGRLNVWSYRHDKRDWTDRVQWAIRAAHCKPPKPFERAHVTIAYYFPTAARHDADNYAGKYLLDGLTQGGVIVDDDLRHITTTICGDVDRKNPRTEIVVQEV